MTVFGFAEDDASNPLVGLSLSDIENLPFGAAELDQQGAVLNYIDTEPGERAGAASKVGGNFFAAVAPWAGRSLIAEEFRKGVEIGTMNAVFDCAAARLPYKVRVHLKISPILGTFWIFIKKLTR